MPIDTKNLILNQREIEKGDSWREKDRLREEAREKEGDRDKEGDSWMEGERKEAREREREDIEKALTFGQQYNTTPDSQIDRQQERQIDKQ